MPRRHRRRPDEGPRETTPGAVTEPIPSPEGWVAMTHAGALPDKSYTCPRCERVVRRSSRHVVARPSDAPEGARRHWHTECWRSAVREDRLDRYRF